MSISRHSLETEYEYPPSIPTVEEAKDVEDAMEALYDKLHGPLSERHERWRNNIRQAGHTKFTCNVTTRWDQEEPDLAPADGWLTAGVTIDNGSAKGKFLAAEPTEIAEALQAITDIEKRLNVARRIFWTAVWDLVDELEFDEEDDDDNEDDSWRGENEEEPLWRDPATNDDSFVLNEHEEPGIEDEGDARSDACVEIVLERNPWLRDLYYAVLAADLTEHASAPE